MGAAKVVQFLLYYIVTLFGWIVTSIASLIFSKIYDAKAEVVPPVEDEVMLLSAITLADKIRSREVINKINNGEYLYWKSFTKL